MEMLPSSRRIFSKFGICSLPDGSPFHSKVGQMAIAMLILFIYIVGTWYSALYCLEHYQIGDIDENWFALIQLIGCVPAIASFISLIHQMTNIRDYLDEIQKIFNKCNCAMDLTFFFFVQTGSNLVSDENTASARIYARTNSVCEIVIKWSIAFVNSSYLATLTFTIAAGIIYYSITDGHVDTENLHLLVKMK